MAEERRKSTETSAEPSSYPSSAPVRHVRKSAKLTRKKKIIMLIALIMLAVFLILFMIAAIVQNNGDFTVNLNFKNNREGVSLYDNRLFENPTSRLAAQNIRDCDAMALEDFDRTEYRNIDDLDGSHNGENYFAYSFYIKNVSPNTVQYTVSLDIFETVKRVEAAVRVVVYEDSLGWGQSGNARTRSVYALARDNGTPEPNTLPFPADNVAYYSKRENFKPGECRKYTVVLFLEGNDPECENSLSGGMIRMGMSFQVFS